MREGAQGARGAGVIATLLLPTQCMCYACVVCMLSSSDASSDNNHATLALSTKHHSTIALKKIAPDSRPDTSSRRQYML